MERESDLGHHELLRLLASLVLSYALLPARFATAQALVGPVIQPEQSIHQVELEQHRGVVPSPVIVPEPTTLRAGSLKSVRRIVYGYYPYWVTNLTSIRWSALSHLAWFTIELDATGAIVARHGWSDNATVDAAHAAGVRVDLTFALFGGQGVLALCQDAGRRATAISNMIDEMEAGNADGISVDFEGLIDGSRDLFTTFIAELRQGLQARGHTDKQISIAGPAVNWAGADGISEFDLNALLDHADIFFIMGYGYFWSGSSRAGPTGMLWLSPFWRAFQNRSMLRSIAEYSAEIPAHKRSQIVWGVPYYGREWITMSDQMGALVANLVRVVTYSDARADLAAGRTRLWDDGAQNPWYVWQASGSWHQAYYDDEQSLAAKYQLALDQHLGGVGMWALNYDQPHQELWDQLEQSFGAEPAPTLGGMANPIAVGSFPYHDERDTRSGPSSYFNFYSCAASLPEYGREWIYQIDVCQNGTVSASVIVDPAHDLDVHLLTDLDQDACIDRADADLATAVTPGRYYLVVDSFVSNLLPAEGAYSLDVDFVADPGQVACASGQVCEAGTCGCAQPELSACADSCVDTSSDNMHCGGCANMCAAHQSCVSSTCLEDRGCGCQVGARASPAAPWVTLFVAALLLVGMRTRRRRLTFVRPIR